MMGNGMMGGGMGIWMFLGMVFWILLIVGIVLLVVWVVQKAMGGGAGRLEESALEILKKRYARGEISKEEYEEKKRDLLYKPRHDILYTSASLSRLDFPR